MRHPFSSIKNYDAPFDGTALDGRRLLGPERQDPRTQGLKPGTHPRIRGAQDPKTQLRTLTDKDLGTGETQAPQNRGGDQPKARDPRTEELGDPRA